MSRLSRLRPALLFAILLSLVGCQKQVPPPAGPADPGPAQRLESLKRTVAAGDCATARPALAEITRQLPDSAEAYLLLGVCAARQNDPEQAEIALSRAATLDAGNPRPQEALGILRYGGNQPAAAREALAKAAALHSANPQTYYYLGNLAMAAGDCPTALESYRKAMVMDPSYGDVFKEYRAAANACAKANWPATAP
ncbi:tetratricopeptide repeat protein [Solidesulfovibrio sp.]